MIVAAAKLTIVRPGLGMGLLGMGQFPHPQETQITPLRVELLCSMKFNSTMMF